MFVLTNKYEDPFGKINKIVGHCLRKFLVRTRKDNLIISDNYIRGF